MAKSVSKGKRRITFEIEAPPGSVVAVAGSFNDWDPQRKALVDKTGTGNYRGTLMLDKGTYEYKFVVDDNWCVDPRNPNFQVTGMGTMNSVLVVD